MTPETREFLLWLLGQTSLSAGDPNFEKLALSIIQARKELEA